MRQTWWTLQYLWKPLLIFVAIVLGLPCLVQADTSYELHHPARYGNCRVWSQVDMLTDEESHHLECGDATATHPARLGVSFWGNWGEVAPGCRKGTMVLCKGTVPRIEARLSTGLTFHGRSKVAVALRIDKGPLIRKSGLWDDHARTALIRERGFPTSLMDAMATGNHAILQVGEERGSIRLDGAVAAIADFRGRIQPDPVVP